MSGEALHFPCAGVIPQTSGVQWMVKACNKLDPPCRIADIPDPPSEPSQQADQRDMPLSLLWWM